MPSATAAALSALVHDIPVTTRADMRVPARVYADDELWRQIALDHSLTQLMNVATLRGITQYAYGMPDIHEGYGFPVGGVAALRASDGVISPGGVGYDINCGVRLLACELQEPAVRPHLRELVHELSRSIPSGTGRGGRLALTPAELDRVLGEGCRYLLDRELATLDDLEVTEANGSLGRADPSAVSERAKTRGRDQLGTLGSGNHFLEVEVVEEIFDPVAARLYGLEPGRVGVLVHTGSRGLGHQVCADYVRLMDQVMPRYGITLPDRELACAPFASPEGQRYFGAMCAAANFAWCNRQAITQAVREVFQRFFGTVGGLRLVYDVAHNMAKLEDHDGELLCVHRKGATRSFGPSHPETPARYRRAGQPVFIPGSMGTRSYVLAGMDEGLTLSFGSACHGAGRAMSRHAAKRTKPGSEVRRELEAQGIAVACSSSGELAEEAPFAYKDVERVVAVVHRAGLARKVARLRPIGVVKG
ncbi:MAG TPA: RtcB family protein [Gemmatimonadales bacterium]|nr:RtcB family protein [Gemmatimonadales bacterium]